MIVLLVIAAAVGGYLAGYAVTLFYVTRPVCGHWSCSSRADPRCVAGSCTYHCQTTLGCNGACIHLWEDAVKHGDIPLPGADGRGEVDLRFLDTPPR